MWTKLARTWRGTNTDQTWQNIKMFGPENSEPNKKQFRQTNNIRRGQHGECTVENNLFVTVSKIRNSGILTRGLEFWSEKSQTMSLVFQDHR